MDPNAVSGTTEQERAINLGMDESISWKRVLAGVAIGFAPMALFAASISNSNVDLNLPEMSAAISLSSSAIGAPNSGDINGDGRVSTVDVLWLNRFLVGVAELSEEQQMAADVNSDGSINAIDKTILRALVLRLIDSVPVTFGDLDFDGVINVRDVVLAASIKDGSATEVSKNQKFLANVVRDSKGEINDNDISALRLKSTNVLASLPVYLGDMDGDYTYSLRDLVLLRRVVTSSDEATGRNKFAGDINGDGKIDNMDVAAMRALLLNRSSIGN